MALKPDPLRAKLNPMLELIAKNTDAEIEQYAQDKAILAEYEAYLEYTTCRKCHATPKLRWMNPGVEFVCGCDKQLSK